MTVAKQLPTLWPLAMNTVDSNDHKRQSSSEPLSTLCRLVLTLLQDSDLDVRTQIASAVVKILPGVKSIDRDNSIMIIVIVNDPICLKL